MREAFGAPAESPNLQPGLLRWKYHDSGPLWNGSRSYVIRKDAAPVAHAGIWPIRLGTPTGTIQALQALDWAASKTSPGAGVLLMRKLEGLAEVLITTGGSESTRRVLPQIGFEQRGSMSAYARVLRPWDQFRTRPAEGSKAGPRLLRNALWSCAPLADVRQWSGQAAPPSPQILAALESRPVDHSGSRYSAEFLDFMLRCPTSRVSHFALLNQGQARGFFVLSRVGGQTRIADLRILAEAAEDWASAYAVATRIAKQDPEACEVHTVSAIPVVGRALEANGFRCRGNVPVYVRDPGRRLAGAGQLHLSMLDDDSAFLNFPEQPYAT